MTSPCSDVIRASARLKHVGACYVYVAVLRLNVLSNLPNVLNLNY